jgi:hypothetical protein
MVETKQRGLIRMWTEVPSNQFFILLEAARQGRKFTLDEIKKIAEDSGHQDIARVWWEFMRLMAINDYRYSVSEILEMGNPANQEGITIANILVANGDEFTVTQLLDLDNPADKEGVTVAHLMACLGHRFPVPEIRKSPAIL